MFRVLRPAEFSGKKPAKVNTRRDVLRTSVDNNMFLQNSPVSKEFRYTPELVIVPWWQLPHFLKRERSCKGIEKISAQLSSSFEQTEKSVWTWKAQYMLSFQMNHVRTREKERESSKFFKVSFKCIHLSWSLSLVMYAKELTTSSCMKKAKINPGWRKSCHNLSNSDFKWDLESIFFPL